MVKISGAMFAGVSSSEFNNKSKISSFEVLEHPKFLDTNLHQAICYLVSDHDKQYFCNEEV